MLLLFGPVEVWGAEPLSLSQTARQAEAEHRFADAARDLRLWLRQHPTDGPAWLRLASVAAVRADVVTATAACANAAPFVDPIAALACRGRVGLVSLEYERAYAPLVAALGHQRYAHRNDIWTTWACGVAAELAVAQGLDDAADRLFQRALRGAAAPTPQIEAAWLDHLLATGRYRQVLAATSAREPLDMLQLRRMIALQRLGMAQEGASLRAYLHWQYQSELERGEFLHAREIARFYLDVLPDTERARLAAENNLDYQREAQDYALYHRAFAVP
ncbi:MAG: hypothetical protein KDI01_08065 [Halioglobus sp.]|nr:hypothetical protein [Halioglobus sp.]